MILKLGKCVFTIIHTDTYLSMYTRRHTNVIRVCMCVRTNSKDGDRYKFPIANKSILLNLNLTQHLLTTVILHM